MNTMKPYRDKIDDVSKMFIEKYFKDDYEEIMDIASTLNERYENAYGDSRAGNNFIKNTEQDLYQRLGNSILSECRELIKEERKSIKYNKANSKTYFHNMKRIRGGMSKSMYDLKMALRKDINSIKNQREYEKKQMEDIDNGEYIK